jgi:hypothetical protein
MASNGWNVGERLLRAKFTAVCFWPNFNYLPSGTYKNRFALAIRHEHIWNSKGWIAFVKSILLMGAQKDDMFGRQVLHDLEPALVNDLGLRMF